MLHLHNIDICLQIWGLAIAPQGNRVVAAYSTPHLEVFRVNEGAAQAATTSEGLLHSLGFVPRSMNDRAASVGFSPCGKLLACLGSGKTVELFR